MVLVGLTPIWCIAQPISQVGNDIDGSSFGDESGTSVAISADGSIVAIGAPNNEDAGTASGQVRVFQYNGTTWLQLGQDIGGEAVDDESGIDVDMSSDGMRVAIGAYLNDGGGNRSGHVRVYDYNGSSWTQTGLDIDGAAANNFSGFSLSLSQDGTRLAVGAYGNGSSQTVAGHVRVYQMVSGQWVQLGQDLEGEEHQPLIPFHPSRAPQTRLKGRPLLPHQYPVPEASNSFRCRRIPAHDQHPFHCRHCEEHQ